MAQRMRLDWKVASVLSSLSKTRLLDFNSYFDLPGITVEELLLDRWALKGRKDLKFW